MRVVGLTLLSKQRHSQLHLNTLTESCFKSASLPLYSPPSLAPLLQSVNNWHSNVHWAKEAKAIEGRRSDGRSGEPREGSVYCQISCKSPPPVPQFMIRRTAARAVECSPAAFTWKYYSVLLGRCACCKSLALLEMCSHRESVSVRRLWELHAERWLLGCCNTFIWSVTSITVSFDCRLSVVMYSAMIQAKHN